jgi:hypothetical protein
MPSGIEPEVTKFMWRIIRTLVAGLIWMLIQVIAGIRTGYAFADNGLSWKNILYYCGAILSFAALLYYYYKLWRGRL